MPVETVSPAEFTEEPVLFLDFVFVGGERDQLTIRARDSVDWSDPNIITVRLFRGTPTPDAVEEIIYARGHIVCHRTLAGVLKHPVKKPEPKNV